MKTSEQWTAEDTSHVGSKCDDCHRLIRAIQADAIEAAAAKLEARAEEYGSGEEWSDALKWGADAVRKLKETL